RQPQPTAPAAPVDRELMSAWQLARYAFDERQYDQAAQMYARVLERAYARDDLGAIGDVGYELAVVRLRQLDPAAAAAQARQTRAELRRRGDEPFAELYLVEAVALYELGEETHAAARADEAIALAPRSGGPAAMHAWFLKGRIAADHGDAAGIGNALAALGGSSNPELRADRLELTGRLELLEDRPERALAAHVAELGLHVGLERAGERRGELHPWNAFHPDPSGLGLRCPSLGTHRLCRACRSACRRLRIELDQPRLASGFLAG